MESNLTKKKLQTSKNKLTNDLWEYRGFLLEKKDKEWIVKIPDNKKIRNQEQVLGYANLLIKECCLRIDELLGIIPEEIKKIEFKKKLEEKFSAEVLPKKGFGRFNLNFSDAKVKAYEFRNDKDLNLGVPNKTKELGLIGFSLVWYKIDIKSIEISEKLNEKYKEKFTFKILEKDNITTLEVNVII